LGDRDRDHDEDGVEELGEEIIVAQQIEAHAPAPRVQVATDHPSVVIAQHPAGHVPTIPPRRRSERMEKTVVIRDRKSLERLRREASRHPRAPKRSNARAIYLVGFAVLASLAAGTLLATLANSTSSEDVENAAASAHPNAGSIAPLPSQAAPEVVDLEDLPVETKKKKKKTNGD